MSRPLTKQEVIELVEDADQLLSDAALTSQLDPAEVNKLYSAVGDFLTHVRGVYHRQTVEAL